MYVDVVDLVHALHEVECGVNHLGITFTTKDFEHVKSHKDDPIVVTIRVNNYVTKKVFQDQGSSRI